MSGLLYVIAAPSGAGKTSLVNALVSEEKNLLVSVSYTTRARRPAEQEEVNYHFISEAEFQTMIKAHAFLEYAQVFGHYYGTGQKWVIEQLAAGKNVILEIDWQGAQQIRAKFPTCIKVFIVPPSLKDLEERLIKRKQDSNTTIQQRMKAAQQEMEHYREFDYMVINDSFEHALVDLRTIIHAERLKTAWQMAHHKDLLEALL